MTKEKTGLDSDVNMQTSAQSVSQGTSGVSMEGATDVAGALQVDTQGKYTKTLLSL